MYTITLSSIVEDMYSRNKKEFIKNFTGSFVFCAIAIFLACVFPKQTRYLALLCLFVPLMVFLIIEYIAKRRKIISSINYDNIKVLKTFLIKKVKSVDGESGPDFYLEFDAGENKRVIKYVSEKEFKRLNEDEEFYVVSTEQDVVYYSVKQYILSTELQEIASVIVPQGMGTRPFRLCDNEDG